MVLTSPHIFQYFLLHWIFAALSKAGVVRKNLVLACTHTLGNKWTLEWSRYCAVICSNMLLSCSHVSFIFRGVLSEGDVSQQVSLLGPGFGLCTLFWCPLSCSFCTKYTLISDNVQQCARTWCWPLHIFFNVLCYTKFSLFYPKQALSTRIWFWLVRILLQTNEHWNDQDTVQ